MHVYHQNPFAPHGKTLPGATLYGNAYGARIAAAHCTKKRRQSRIVHDAGLRTINYHTGPLQKAKQSRLYREFYHLFGFVIRGVDWHNNTAGRATRRFVLLRKVMYGNRSEFDHETYATLLSIIGTCTMRNVNPPEYIVTSLSKPTGSQAVLPAVQT